MTKVERRRHPRQAKDAPLILIQQEARESREGVILRDISLGGLAFETSLPLAPGGSIGFALYVPTRGWVDGTGRICWSKPTEVGWLCGAEISVRHWDQEKLLRKWLHPTTTGLLRFFFAK